MAVFILALMPFAAKGDDAVVSEAIAAMQNRSQRVHSLKFVWNEECFEPKGSKSTNPAIPPADTKYTLKKTLYVDGQMIRYEFEGQRPNRDYSEIRQQEFVSAYDGSLSKTFFPTPNTVAYPCGFINKDKTGYGGSVVDAMPVLACFFALQPEIGVFERTALRSAGRKGVIDGSEFAITFVASSGSSSKHYLWLDPRREYIIVRVIRENQRGSIERQIDINYDRDDTAGWLPVSWTIETISEKVPPIVSKSEVVERRINPVLKKSDFQIEFPVGTVVTDSTRLSPEGRPRDFVINKRGDERVIKDSERGLPVEYFVNSDNREDGVRSINWLWWISLASAILFGALTIWSRLRARRAIQ